MRREEISKRQFLRIIKELNGGYIYNDHGRMIKFDLTYLSEMKKYRQLLSAFSSINVEQIEWLSNVRVKNSHLPEGVVICDRTPVGVIYPHYFEGYKSLFHVSEEDSGLMIDNMKTAVDNNLEFDVHLDDCVYLHRIYLKQPTTNLILCIKDVYKGDKWDDTCVSGIIPLLR